MKMYCNCISLYIITWNKGENRKKKKKKKKKNLLGTSGLISIKLGM